jgi:hypothetical protein
MKPEPAKKAEGKDFTAFRKLYDKSLIIPERIKVALASLGEGWESEADFVKRCNLSTSDFARYRDFFADYFIEVRAMGKGPTRVWAGTTAYTEKLRETLK